MFCKKHIWDKLDRVILPSQAEILHSMGYTPNTHTNCRQKLVTDYQCTECGKLRRLITITA